jgi:hypothetical protein
MNSSFSYFVSENYNELIRLLDEGKIPDSERVIIQSVRGEKL